MPRLNLEGSSSIITGGASGIGEASARQLAAAGSRVVIADLNEEKGQAIALMGSSGRSTGTHVHFEVLRDGKTVNPMSYIQAAR